MFKDISYDLLSVPNVSALCHTGRAAALSEQLYVCRYILIDIFIDIDTMSGEPKLSLANRACYSAS